MGYSSYRIQVQPVPGDCVEKNLHLPVDYLIRWDYISTGVSDSRKPNEPQPHIRKEQHAHCIRKKHQSTVRRLSRRQVEGPAARSAEPRVRGALL